MLAPSPDNARSRLALVVRSDRDAAQILFHLATAQEPARVWPVLAAALDAAPRMRRNFVSRAGQLIIDPKTPSLISRVRESMGGRFRDLSATQVVGAVERLPKEARLLTQHLRRRVMLTHPLTESDVQAVLRPAMTPVKAVRRDDPESDQLGLKRLTATALLYARSTRPIISRQSVAEVLEMVPRTREGSRFLAYALGAALDRKFLDSTIRDQGKRGRFSPYGSRGRAAAKRALASEVHEFAAHYWLTRATEDRSPHEVNELLIDVCAADPGAAMELLTEMGAYPHGYVASSRQLAADAGLPPKPSRAATIAN